MSIVEAIYIKIKVLLICSKTRKARMSLHIPRNIYQSNMNLENPDTYALCNMMYCYMSIIHYRVVNYT